MDKSLQEVAMRVNTARSVRLATLCGMDEQKIRKTQGARLAHARKAAGYRSAREAALQNEWKESSYRAHEGGTRTIGQDDAERYATRFRFDGVQVTARGILFGDDDVATPTEDGGNRVSVVGAISAGGQIETSAEQIRPGGNLFEIQVPFPVPEGTIAFRVEGPSMHPRYDPDDVVLCSEHGESPERLLGLYAAVTTIEGNRYLKRVLKGSRRGHYHLESHNAPLISDARLKWASGIIATVHVQHWDRISAAAAADAAE